MNNIVDQILRGDYTLPRLLAENYQKFAEDTAMLKKSMGIWQQYTWKDYYQKVKALSLCMITLGLQPGDKVCIIGDNDPEWWISELAVLCSLGVSVGVYPDSTAGEVEYIVKHSDSRLIVAKDQEQCDKILAIRERVPKLIKILFWDPKGMWHYKDSILCSFDSAYQLGAEYEKRFPNLFHENLKIAKTDDIAVICYTSGTTALPKGVMMNTKALLLGGINLLQYCPLEKGENYLAFLSPAWATEQVLGIASTLYFAAVTCFAEKAETIRSDMREVGPAMVFYGSRQWENIVSEIEVGMRDSTPMKRFFYKLFLPIGYRVAEAHFHHNKVHIGWRLLHKLGDWLVFRQIRDYLGLRKVRLSITSGSYLGPEVVKFFKALGIDIFNVYGSTEAVSATVETPHNFKLGSAGKAVPGVDIKITEEGEVIIRGANVFRGYYKAQEATEEKLKNGWFYTGDAGYLDEEGYLFYLDRIKDMAVMKDGSRFSPTYIESALKFSTYIKDAMALGQAREYLVVLISIDFETVGRWAEKHHIVYTTYADLSQKPQVQDLVQKEVEAINQSLPRTTRVKKFANLHKEFDADEGELTRTRKLRRNFLQEKYGYIIDAMYGGAAGVRATMEVKYRDGRSGITETDISIRDVP